MTKSLLVVIFILGFLGSLYLEPAFAPSRDYISGSEPDGFRGITWETNIADVQDQFIDTGKIDQSFGGIKLYTRKNDEMTIGGSNLDEILYSFWQGKFFAVKISVTGPSNFSALRDACFTKFGKGYHSSGSKTTVDYIWDGDKTGMHLKYNDITKKGLLWLSSRKMMETADRERKKLKEEKAKKGGGF